MGKMAAPSVLPWSGLSVSAVSRMRGERDTDNAGRTIDFLPFF